MKNETIEVKNPNEVILSTGKKIIIRQRKGQHHIVENRLLSACAAPKSDDGLNIGDFMMSSEISTAVAIEEIDGVKVKIPKNLAKVYELADRFTYDEWTELKVAIQPKKEEVEKLAKNLQTSIGSDNV